MNYDGIIGVILGGVIGGVISIITNYFNNRALKQNRILEEKLSIYKEISKIIIDEKLEFESSLAQIAQLKKKQLDNKIQNDKAEKLFFDECDRLEASCLKIYSLFTYSYILEGQSIEKLNELYALLTRMDPETILKKEYLQKIGQAFENVLSNLSMSLGIKKQIKICNPHKLINESMGT